MRVFNINFKNNNIFQQGSFSVQLNGSFFKIACDALEILVS